MKLLDTIFSGPQFLAGNRRLFLFCLLLFVVSGLLSCWIFFPADVLQRYLLREVAQQTGLRMEGSEAEMLFPLGLELDLKAYPRHPELLPLLFSDLQVTPVWTSLLSGSPAADLQADFAGGSVDAQITADGQLQLALQGIKVDTLQQADLPYRLQGELSGHLAVADMATALNGKGDFTLQLHDSYLLGLELFGLPERLPLGLLQLAGKFNQRRFSIEKVLLTEGNIEMSGGGTLLIAETPEQTRLNLNLRLHPTQSTPDSLRDLLNLSGVKPTADGSYLLRVSGTLARPTLR